MKKVFVTLLLILSLISCENRTLVLNLVSPQIEDENFTTKSEIKFNFNDEVSLDLLKKPGMVVLVKKIETPESVDCIIEKIIEENETYFNLKPLELLEENINYELRFSENIASIQGNYLKNKLAIPFKVKKSSQQSGNISVTITSPINNTYQSNNSVTLTGTAAGENLAKVMVSIDSEIEFTEASGKENWTKTFTSLSNGEHTFRVYSENTNKDKSEVKILKVKIDIEKPVVTITSPENNHSQIETSITISGTATDNNELEHIYISIDSGTFEKITTANNWSKTYSNLSISQHTVKVYAVDEVGNNSAEVSVSFNIISPQEVTVMSWNVENFRSNKFTEMATVIKNASVDIVVFCEVQNDDGDEGNIKSALSSISYPMQNSYITSMSDSYNSIMIVSRFPISNTSEILKSSGNTRSILRAEVDIPGGQSLWVYGCHLKARSSGLNKRKQEAQNLADYIKNNNNPEQDNIIIVGDMNTTELPGEAGNNSTLGYMALKDDSNQNNDFLTINYTYIPNKHTQYWQTHDKQSTLDHLISSNSLTSKYVSDSVDVVPTEWSGGGILSDHRPVYATFEF